ncbi:3-oxoacyl-[acyl-carrier-protein] reductase FabG [Stomoxys calcitrans]|uniref:3-oxoacyl-[acyl-carrier-protein] reductase FabG n=1 Tax=Stomoxys calcitrans TaxID=35570 RepID=UPI0027E244C5|nr:3-oxoacyl-[acyl-carrier-protein] reductase FabG [Stomoxys calcitrans]
MDFVGKVALITGASSGIGAATAETFAKYGANLALVGRNVNKLNETENKCKQINSNINCLSVVADVTTDSEKILNACIGNFQRLDVLVNNAGILAGGSLMDIDLEQFDNVLNTNLRAVFSITKLSLPYLINAQGNIVNVSSVAGQRSFPDTFSYCISKAALDQFTKCLSLDLASKNVRVNSVNPGVVITDIHKTCLGMSEKDYAEYLEICKGTHAMGRVGNAFEVAETIAFLASGQASFITGALLPVDGGRHAMCPR